MASIAEHERTGELHGIDEADFNEEYLCPHDCDGSASPVRAHMRDLSSGDQTPVSPHFRYYCQHGMQTERQASPGDRTGGGGGGESPIHERRKVQAKWALRQTFDAAYHTTEHYIGDKRCDGVVILENPDDLPGDWGKGFAIEYQHKNEQKDMEATERHYARHNYTTLWLWEDQFTFEGKVPDVDLFGGRVFKPWPEVMHAYDDWTGTPANRYRLQAIIDNGTTTRVDATLKRSFILPTQQEYWNNESWYSRFRYDVSFLGTPIPGTGITSDSYEQAVRDKMVRQNISGSDALLPPDCVDTMLYNRLDWDTVESKTNPAKRYRMRAAIGYGSTTRADATLRMSFVLPTKQEYWNEMPWRLRFSMRPSQVADSASTDGGVISEVHRREIISMIEQSGAEATIPPKCSKEILKQQRRDSYKIDTADELRERATSNGWQQVSGRTPLRDLRAALEATSGYIYKRNVVCSFSSKHIRGLGGGRITNNALDSMMNKDDAEYSPAVTLFND